jgi:hypothetical protein
MVTGTAAIPNHRIVPRGTQQPGLEGSGRQWRSEGRPSPSSSPAFSYPAGYAALYTSTGLLRHRRRVCITFTGTLTRLGGTRRRQSSTSDPHCCSQNLRPVALPTRGRCPARPLRDRGIMLVTQPSGKLGPLHGLLRNPYGAPSRITDRKG